MIYCFDSDLPWEYSRKEMALSKNYNNGILYDNKTKNFMDFDRNSINIENKVIFPRTGGVQIYDVNEQIICNGGIPVVTNEQIRKIEDWPNFYLDDRNSRLIKGKYLIDLKVVEKIRNVYGNEIFLKTKTKNFSSVIPIELLLDNECAFYKTILHHLDDDFIISKKVDIIKDNYGKKEYRCFIVNNEIYNISRFTSFVFHSIEPKILQKAQEVVENLKGIFPDFYVLDLFEYQLNGKEYIDVLEFNPIHASGLYLYNSCLQKSEDILHSNIKKISHEFIDKIDDCTAQGVIDNRAANLYDIPNGFANHLRSICFNGDIGITWMYDMILSKNDFARHKPIYDFSNAIKTDDDLMRPMKQFNLLDDDIGLNSGEDLKKLIKKFNSEQ